MRLRFFSLFVFLVLHAGCSNSPATKSSTDQSSNSTLAIPIVPKTPAEKEEKSGSISLSADSTTFPRDTIGAKLNGNGILADTVADDSELIFRRLERVRQHYLLAIAAQESGDTTTSEFEFESSIQILNELSEFPGIDSSKEFIDLSQSVVEDYEKYISTIDNLGPYASLFAMREKLSQEVETGDSVGVDVPTYEVQGTSVPLPINEYVERALSFFMGKGRVHIERWMYLSGRYFPMMKRIFREEGVPEEMVILSMPESGMRTDASSWARAVGLWQFMKGTGSMYGLRTNWWYDERRDFEKSTRAAARHLKDLYTDLHDWNLVLGAYNAGAGRIYRAVRRSGSNDFWEMRNHLPRQTRNYIPQYIAVARIVLDPERHGFTNLEFADSLEYDVVEINDCIDLRVLATCAQTTVDTLKGLNPELLRWCTPPGVTGYRFRIPPGRKDSFLVAFAAVTPEQKKDWAIHTVRKGETVSSIAQRYDLSVSLIRDVNNIKSDRRLSIGAALAIPIPRDYVEGKGKVPFDYSPTVRGMKPGSVRAYVDKMDRSSSRGRSVEVQGPKGKTKLTYRVKRGDTIGHIAEWYGVRASDIRNWNDIAYGSPIRAGEVLAVYVDPKRESALKRVDGMEFSEKQSMLKGEIADASPTPKSARSTAKVFSQDWIQHRVESGETLEHIAKMYDVTISDLKQWNKLRTSRINAGQSLDIFDKPEEKVKIIPQGTLRAGVERQTSSRSTGVFAPTHKVERGQTLYDIARQYGVEVSEIKKNNNLRTNKIVVGQTLRIPPKVTGE